MKFSAVAFASFVALAVAQGPPKGGKGMGGKGKGMGGKGGGGFPGGGAGGFPGGGAGGFPGGGGGGFAKLACAKSCLAPIKDSGCKFPFPKKGDGSGPSPGGPPPGLPPAPKAPGAPKGKANIVERQAPPGGDAPPRPKIDPEAMKQFNTCLCTNKGIMDSLQTCVPKECSGEGEAAPIFNIYNRMCKSVEGFKPLDVPAGAGGAGGAAAPPSPPAPAAHAGHPGR